MQGYYYIVHKTPKGWRTYTSIMYLTLDEAKVALQRVERAQYDLGISRKMPASIGRGWTSLDRNDLVNIGDLA